ncbi:MAG: hypothetical protein SPH68_02815 [Candidatus Borkfalkiaceae bacterium]|nr:hypothetical protein [Clostridia bacterium]MDY6223079.1 hypothetical protein [Christensenellaceae bacterium]
MLFVQVAIIATVSLCVINAALSQNVLAVLPVSAWQGVLWSVLAAAFSVALDAIIALFIRRALPKKWFDHKKPIFTVGAKEKKFYEKIKIRKWKDKIPEWGKFTAFSKNKIARPSDNEYLDKYFQELCYGEMIHFVSAAASFAALFFVPRPLILSVGLPVAVVNALCNLPSAFILRYNSYKLEVLYKNNEKKAVRRQQTAVSSAVASAISSASSSEEDKRFA